MGSSSDKGQKQFPRGSKIEKASTLGLKVGGAIIPGIGGLLSLFGDYFSGKEQDGINEFLRAWMQMLEDEWREKEKTIAEIIIRLDMQDEEIANRIKSRDYQSLLKKAFRNWSAAESEKKRIYIRNILANAAGSSLASMDVISLFIDWLSKYSEFHFAVIGEIYSKPGSTRFEIWTNLGKGEPREDSAEADLYKLLFRDLSTGGVVRQHRETDGYGNFIKKTKPKGLVGGPSSRTMKSAFDNDEPYELTSLGEQFVHYAMNELTPKIEFYPNQGETENGEL